MLDIWINRTDCHGAYSKKTGAPFTAKKTITDDLLRRHLAGKTTIGVHAIAPDNTSRWACLDIDAHGGEREDENHTKALGIVQRLDADGYEGCIEDSDGRGGRHVWVFFREPVPAADAYHFAREYCPDGVEAFPKQDHVTGETGPDAGPGSFGSWVRLPGKHHKRDHWSRIWIGFDWMDWTDGVADWMDDPPLSPAPPAAPVPVVALSRTTARGEGAEPLALMGSGDPDHDFATIERCLDAIGEPHVSDYMDWIRAGLVVYRCKPGLLGLATWDEWSQKSTKYTADGCLKAWQGFAAGETHPNPVGIGTLVKWAGLDLSSYAADALDKVNPTAGDGERISGDKRAAVLAMIGEALGAPIERITQRGREMETHLMCITVAGTERILGGFDQLCDQRAWRKFLAVCFGVAMSPVEKDAWAKLHRHILACVEIDMHVDHSPEGMLASMLADYIADHPAEGRTGDTVMGEPFVDAGRLWIHVPSLVDHLQRRRAWMPRNLLTWARGLGFDAGKAFKFSMHGCDRSTTRRYWSIGCDDHIAVAALSGGPIEFDADYVSREAKK